MANTKTKKTTTKTGEAPPGRGRSTKSTRRTRPVRSLEVLPFGPTPVPVEEFRQTFGKALRLAATEDRGAEPAVVRSRASVMAWRSALGVPFEEAERSRVGVFAGWCHEVGRWPVRGVIAPGDPSPAPVRGEDSDPIRVPRGHSLRGDKVRRGGER